MAILTKKEYETPEVKILRLNINAPVLTTSGNIQQLDENDWEWDWTE